MNWKEPVNSLDDIKWVDQEDDGYENGAGLSTELADFRSWTHCNIYTKYKKITRGY